MQTFLGLMRYLFHGNFKKYCFIYNWIEEGSFLVLKSKKTTHRLHWEVKLLVQRRGVYLANVLTARYVNLDVTWCIVFWA